MERNTTIRPFALGAGLCLCAAGCTGFLHSTKTLKHGAARVVFACLDTSASNRNKLPAETIELALGCQALDPVDRLDVIRFDCDIEQIRSDSAPRSPEDLMTELIPRLAPKARTNSTRFDVLFPEVVKRCQGFAGRSIVAIWTDGFMDGVDKLGHQKIRASAIELSVNPRVAAVYLIGSDPRAYQVLSEDLAPLIGSKLHMPNVKATDPTGLAREFAEVLQ